MPMPQGARRGSLNPCEFEARIINEENPDLSFLGKYSNTLEPDGIDRQERGDRGRNEYRYFNVGSGDSAYIDQDYERMEAYNRGEWRMTGVMVKAIVTARNEAGDWVEKEFLSHGLWGVESDSDKGHILSVIGEELNDLQGLLETNGFHCAIPDTKNVRIVQE